MSTKRFITAVEAAKIADCETQYIRRLAAVGKAFTAERHEGRIQIEYASFKAWLAGYLVRRHRPVFEGEASAVTA